MRVTHVDAECSGGKAQPKCRCSYHCMLTHLNNMKRTADAADVKAIKADLEIIKTIGRSDYNKDPRQCEGKWSWLHKDKLDSVPTATSVAAAAPTTAAPTYAPTTATTKAPIKLIQAERLQSDTTKSITIRAGPAPATAAGESLPLALPLSSGDIASTAAHVACFLAYLQGIEQSRNKDEQVKRT